MSFCEGMRGRGVPLLGGCNGFLLKTRSRAMRFGVGGDVSTRVAEVVRAGAGGCAGLVRGYLAGAIGTMINYKKR